METDDCERCSVEFIFETLRQNYVFLSQLVMAVKDSQFNHNFDYVFDYFFRFFFVSSLKNKLINKTRKKFQHLHSF